MKLSIIIPVYQTAKTLERCVESVMSQGYTDMEVLLIDDGSTDGSASLADRLAARHGSIRVFHKENGGLSSARNRGLMEARGDYVVFLDSDDALGNDTLLPLMRHVTEHPEVDILEFSVVERVGEPDEHLFLTADREYGDAMEWLAEKGLTHCWAWNKVYRRDILDGLLFPEGKHYEDVYFLGDLLQRRPHIATTSVGRYLYYWNAQGIVAARNMSELLQAQLTLVDKLAIDTRERRWHRLYMDMVSIQLHAWQADHTLPLPSHRVDAGLFPRRNDRMKAWLLNMFGLKTMCRLFNIISTL